MTPSSTVQVWAFVFDQADGHAREDTANVAWRTAAVKLDDGKLRVFLSHDSLRIHFLELSLASFPRSTSGVEAVSEGNHPLKLLTSADIGVRVSAAWLGTQESLSLNKLRRGIFTGASRSPCGLVTVASSTSSAVPWDFVGLWHVAVVHRFHMGPTLLEVMRTSLCLGGYGNDFGRGCLPGELARLCFVASQCHTRLTKTK